MTNVREDATIPAQEPLRGRPQHLPHQRADRGRRAVQARAAGLTPWSSRRIRARRDRPGDPRPHRGPRDVEARRGQLAAVCFVL